MTPDPWGRLIAGVIPPGQSLDTTNKYMQLVQKMHVGHEIQMGTADDGTTVLFYYADAKPSPDVIVEETDPNLTLEVGFDTENGEQGVLRQDFTEKDEAILGLASLMIPILDGWDAANYVTSTIMHGDEKFAVTVQRVGGMTPAEKIAWLEGKLEALEG